MTSNPLALDVVLALVDRINAHDLAGIIGLLHADYHHVDPAGDQYDGLDWIRGTWAAHFARHPDYRLSVERTLVDGDTVGLFGRSAGTMTRRGELPEENHWEFPAAFLATVADGRVKSWQVYLDPTMMFDLIKANETV